MAVLTILLAAAGALAHEERLVSGRVETWDAEARALLVDDRAQDRTVRITVDPDTEVRRCRAETGNAALRPGAHVRVKYLDRGREGLETLSVVVLDGQGR
ncbi:MAG: hypothetical protein HYR51_03410 [Candidatus Rokubacteria bacterium]|nr:hypothetical protein [Candidatus Rokubacteria bacterium]